MSRRAVAIALAVATGVGVEFVIEVTSGRREAWDSELYWSAGLPVALVSSCIIGAVARGRDWLWAAAIIPSQVLMMALMSANPIGGLALWPLTGALSSVLSLPFLAASFAASRLRHGFTGAGSSDTSS